MSQYRVDLDVALANEELKKSEKLGDYYFMVNTSSSKISFSPGQIFIFFSDLWRSGILPIFPFLLLVLVLCGPWRSSVGWLACWIIALAVIGGTIYWTNKKALICQKASEPAERAFGPYWLVIMVIACVSGFGFGEYMWDTYWKPFEEYMHLKWIKKPINPLLDSGLQFQDAGVVDFSMDSYIDRSHGGCYRTDADTFCVVPILQDVNSVGSRNRVPMSPTGSYDYFAVGKNCCSCPSAGDFQCGDWDHNDAQGGLRILDPEGRANYYLAVQQWEAAYDLQARTPLFFEWVNRPFKKLNGLQEDRLEILWVYSLVALLLLVVLASVSHYIRWKGADQQQQQANQERGARTTDETKPLVVSNYNPYGLATSSSVYGAADDMSTI